MTQYYIDPMEVNLSDDSPRWPSRHLKLIIDRDGLIEPILVRHTVIQDDVEFEAADSWQSERVLACRELGFETILIEDEWEAGDL
jgi:hypothetical protein